jgi:hypothetical protein
MTKTERLQGDIFIIANMSGGCVNHVTFESGWCSVH